MTSPYIVAPLAAQEGSSEFQVICTAAGFQVLSETTGEADGALDTSACPFCLVQASPAIAPASDAGVSSQLLTRFAPNLSIHHRLTGESSRITFPRGPPIFS